MEEISQPSLPLTIDEDSSLLTIEERKREPGRHDLSRLRMDEDRVAGILRARASGLGLRAVSKAFRCSTRTITLLEERHASTVATLKQEMAKGLRSFSRMAIDRLQEEIDSIPVGQLPVAMAIAIDKMQLLDGDPTAIIERRERTPDINSLIDALPVYAEEVEVPGPVAPGEIPGQKGIEDLGGEAGEEVEG